LDKSKVNIRKAINNDIPTMTDIYNAIIGESTFTADLKTYTLEERQTWFEKYNNEKYGIYVLEISSAVIGYFYFSPWRSGRTALDGVAELSFYLSKNARGLGLGDMILDQAIIMARSKNFTHLLAILLDINTRSQKLLGKWGFEVVGKLPEIVRLKERIAGQLIMLRSIV